MPIQVEFLPTTAPALPQAAAWLLNRYQRGPTADLAEVVVVVPASQAGRRLRELLVAEAERREVVFFPPQIETVGRLPEQLYESKRPLADELVQRLVWGAVLLDQWRAEPEVIRRVAPHPPAADDRRAWLELGELLRGRHTELAADGCNFQTVVERGDLSPFERARWEALAALQSSYLDRLDALGLWDMQTARLVAIKQRECRTERDVVMIGAVDLNRTQREMLDQVADRVTALIHAPAAWADRFDSHGCLLVEKWQESVIDLADERIELVDGPLDQADAVARALDACGGRYRADDITVGVPDETLAPQIERQLTQCGVPTRYVGGRRLADTGPWRLLTAAAELAAHDRYAELAALVRHPDLHQWLRERIDPTGAAGCFLSLLDEAYGEMLPSRGFDLFRAGAPAPLKKLGETLRSWLGPLRTPRPLPEWGQPLAALLTSVYGGREYALDDERVVACHKIAAALAALAELPAEMSPTVSALESLELAAAGSADEVIPPARVEAAVELAGWLELPLDDAPAVVVTSLNEGFVPSSTDADLFLPDGLRRRLGLLDNQRRLARDAYALTVVTASWRYWRLIVARRDAEGSPLAPSRLLFAADDRTLARRAVRLFGDTPPAAPRPSLGGAAPPLAESSIAGRPLPQPLVDRVDEMSVTSFRSYLECPYRYYLRHVLKLHTLDDAAIELDPLAFGNLLHDTLALFGQDEDIRAATDADRIAAFLHDRLDGLLRRRLAERRRGAIAVQAEQARRRLAAFAQWQAGRAAQGWRILRVEVAASGPAALLDVDGDAMRLRGRIDRIDVHEESGQVIFFDYKSGDSPEPPDKSHGGPGKWKDLQLPLYRRLAPAIDIDPPPALGYIVLPKDTTKTGDRLAEWSEADLEDAEHTAREVVRGVWAEQFAETRALPPDYDEFAAICRSRSLAAWEPPLEDDAVEEGA